LSTADVKVYKGNTEMTAEGSIYRERLLDLANDLNGVDVDGFFA